MYTAESIVCRPRGEKRAKYNSKSKPISTCWMFEGQYTYCIYYRVTRVVKCLVRMHARTRVMLLPRTCLRRMQMTSRHMYCLRVRAVREAVRAEGGCTIQSSNLTCTTAPELRTVVSIMNAFSKQNKQKQHTIVNSYRPYSKAQT